MPPLASAQVRPVDSLAEVVRRYAGNGFPSRFAVRPGGNVRCLSCQRDHPARWMILLALHRLDAGRSPPDTVVAAVECPACEERGTLAMAGSAALGTVEERLVLSLLRSSGSSPGGSGGRPSARPTVGLEVAA